MDRPVPSNSLPRAASQLNPLNVDSTRLISISWIKSPRELFNRMLKSPPAAFSARKNPQRTPEGTPPVLALPAALLNGHFEHPAYTFFCCARTQEKVGV